MFGIPFLSFSACLKKDGLFRRFLILPFVSYLGGVTPALTAQAPTPPTNSLMNSKAASSSVLPVPSTLPAVTLGNETAPLKITMFHSLNCVHCKEFKEKILPKIQEEFIEKGLVHFTFIDFPTDPSALDAAKLAWEGRHVEEYQKVSHLLTTHYEEWAGQPDWQKHLCRILVDNQLMTPEQCEQGLADEALGKAILHTAFTVQQKYKVDYAPAFLFNGQLKITDDLLSVQDVQQEIDKITALKAVSSSNHKVMILEKKSSN